MTLPDPGLLTPIEEEFWTGGGLVPPDGSVAIRRAPIIADKFLAHAVRRVLGWEYSGRDLR